MGADRAVNDLQILPTKLIEYYLTQDNLFNGGNYSFLYLDENTNYCKNSKNVLTALNLKKEQNSKDNSCAFHIKVIVFFVRQSRLTIMKNGTTICKYIPRNKCVVDWSQMQVETVRETKTTPSKKTKFTEKKTQNQNKTPIIKLQLSLLDDPGCCMWQREGEYKSVATVESH